MRIVLVSSFRPVWPHSDISRSYKKGLVDVPEPRFVDAQREIRGKGDGIIPCLGGLNLGQWGFWQKNIALGHKASAAKQARMERAVLDYPTP